MNEGRNAVWIIVGVAVAALVLLGAVFGPGLYRAGRGLVPPLVQLIGVEKRVEALDQELAFVPPSESAVGTERLAVFLQVRRDIEPALASWTALVEEVEHAGDESLDAASAVLAATRDLLDTQLEVLGRHRMAPAEFRWLDDLVYRRWFIEVQEAAALASDERLREVTRDDLQFITDEVARRHGRSAAVMLLEERLRDRLAELEAPRRPEVEGLPEATQELLWSEREAIAALSLEAYDEAPLIIREGQTISVGRHGEAHGD